ncbi:hypothetical protein KC19_VG130200 [Ceratodon purpureus]|uniref:Uncharacterized protein n=1 Tax=Ceratodon purpureus TaxID=3225 RepID=A0A8T0HQM5_CERPU|nr:hypothetical protein KC19_VG130200 [Ceratodon purpureus]
MFAFQILSQPPLDGGNSGLPSMSTFNSDSSGSMDCEFQHSNPNTDAQLVQTADSGQGPRHESSTPVFPPHSSASPPYTIRESIRINALESTVQKMASDLSSSNKQIREVKELLLRLVNPSHPPPIPVNGTVDSSTHTGYTGNDNRESNLAQVNMKDVPESAPDHRPQGNVNYTMAPDKQASALGLPPHQPNSPSWASGDTLPVTPSMLLLNFTNRMAVDAAVSTDVSASIATTSADQSPNPTSARTPRTSTQQMMDVLLPRATVPRAPHLSPPVDIASTVEGVTTRGMAIEQAPSDCGPRMRFDMPLLPHLLNHAIAANSLCFILHPQCGDRVVAEGKIGGSWKSPSCKSRKLCVEGQQMIQVHNVFVPNLPLIYVEERQPFTTLDHALVKSNGSSVYVKWDCKLLHKKKKNSPHSQAVADKR